MILSKKITLILSLTIKANLQFVCSCAIAVLILGCNKKEILPITSQQKKISSKPYDTKNPYEPLAQERPVIDEKSTPHAAKLLLKTNLAGEVIICNLNHQSKLSTGYRSTKLSSLSTNQYEIIDLSGKTYSFPSNKTFIQENTRTGLYGGTNDLLVKKNGYVIFPSCLTPPIYTITIDTEQDKVGVVAIYKKYSANSAPYCLLYVSNHNYLQKLSQYSIEDSHGNKCSFDVQGRVTPLSITLKGTINVFYQKQLGGSRKCLYQES